MACPTSSSSASPTHATPTVTRFDKPSPRRVTIYFQDDAVRERLEETTRQVLQNAMDESKVTSNSALLAKKALKYRKLYARVEGVDTTSPDFNASEFLGVDWCKTPCLRAHCEAAQS